ncbi:GntR family transcriptional regulator [Roseicella frigidaeris]|nr:GntR family transcriptional regulator [Roseicella frigidaeris]
MTAPPALQPEAMPLGKAARSLPDLLSEQLLADIMAGRLPSGARLKEVELAREHAVSRATVREALIALSRRGFVERLPRFGARVTTFAQSDVFDLFELRAVLLGLAARRCAELGGELASRLEGIVAAMEALAADPGTDPQTFSEQAIRAQHLLVGESGNRHLPELYEHLASMSTWRLIRGRATSFLLAERRQQAAGDWRALVTAIRAGDAAAAEQQARELLAHSAEGVRAQLGRGE